MLTSDSLQNQIDRAMSQAVALASSAGDMDNYPLGAVVFDAQGTISAVASRLVEGNDPSAHPELVAIRQACETRGDRYLPGAYLVSTLEPCPMCTAAAIWAKMAGIAYATSQADADVVGARLIGSKFSFRQIRLRSNDVIRAGDPRLALFEGVQREAVLRLYDRFVDRMRPRG